MRVRAHQLCGSGGGRSGVPVPNSHHGLCGRKTKFEEEEKEKRKERKKTSVDVKQHLKKRKKGAGQNSGAV